MKTVPIRISQWRESHCRTNTSIRKNKSKRAGLWESVPSRKVNHQSKVIWKIIIDFPRLISSTRIGKPVLMMDVEVFSKDKNISRWVDWENLIYVRWNRIRGKRSKMLSEVKPVEYISKNLQSFLEISPVQKKFLL